MNGEYVDAGERRDGADSEGEQRDVQDGIGTGTGTGIGVEGGGTNTGDATVTDLGLILVDKGTCVDATADGDTNTTDTTDGTTDTVLALLVLAGDDNGFVIVGLVVVLVDCDLL